MFKLAKKQANTGIPSYWAGREVITPQVRSWKSENRPLQIPAYHQLATETAMVLPWRKRSFWLPAPGLSRAFKGFPGQSMPSSSWAGPVANSSSPSFMTSLPPSDRSSHVPDVTDFLSKPVHFLLLPKSFTVWEQQIEHVACIYRRHITGLESLL